jgi:hypothetical protein
MHLTLDPAKEVYRASAFLHGYIHGYEDGFHAADIDLQMGHTMRPGDRIAEFKRLHRAESRKQPRFVAGYSNGFNVGYTDGFKGGEFRATRELESLAESTGVLPNASSTSQLKDAFDNAMFLGYRAGATRGASDARNNQSESIASPACDAAIGARELSAERYCSWFQQGFAFGYRDGYGQLTQSKNLERASER